MRIAFATNNKNKLREIREILGDKFEILSLDDINCHTDIPETGNTLEENAQIKANYIFDKYQISVFADDTGLEVNALDGAPGVYSARYAGGEGHDSEANMRKLLKELNGKADRKARFRTVIALRLMPDSSMPAELTHDSILFEGIVDGKITTEKKGTSGFGYDPVFQPEGYDKTFAELGDDIKNKISHRAKAVEKLVKFLNSIEQRQ